MKMAKASEADLSMAMELVSALDVLGQRWCPAMPEAIESLQGEDENERFDRDDDAQCGRALRHLLDLTDRASLGRVVWGMAVVCDPRNELLDPEADTVEVHPKFAKLLEASLARVVEPVGYVAPHVLSELKTHSTQACIYKGGVESSMVPIFATPQAEAQPSQAGELSDEEIQTIYLKTHNEGFHGRNLETAFARAVIAAINAKGTP